MARKNEPYIYKVLRRETPNPRQQAFFRAEAANIAYGGARSLAPLVAEHHARRLEPQLRLYGRIGHHGRQLLENALLLVLEVDHVARSRYEST